MPRIPGKPQTEVPFPETEKLKFTFRKRGVSYSRTVKDLRRKMDNFKLEIKNCQGLILSAPSDCYLFRGSKEMVLISSLCTVFLTKK